MSLDIRSNGPYPSKILSNFYPHAFVFENVPCGSMEGLLQAFKFSSREDQETICALSGPDAKIAGRRGNGWKEAQLLFWAGCAFSRMSPEYKELLDKAYIAMFDQCPDFRQALQDSGNELLTHKFGYNNPRSTILTIDEFVARLMWLRGKL